MTSPKNLIIKLSKLHKMYQLKYLFDHKFLNITPVLNIEIEIIIPKFSDKRTGVPLTTVDMYLVLLLPSSNDASRDSPKSATLAVNLESRSMLPALISRWNIGGSASV